MNKNAQKWVEALESGEYKQCHGMSQEENAYCCLMVACVVYEQQTGKTLPRREYDYFLGHSLDNKDLSPVKDWLGLRTGVGGYTDGEGELTNLMFLNDTERLPFSGIVAVIRSEPEGLFVKEGV